MRALAMALLLTMPFTVHAAQLRCQGKVVSFDLELDAATEKATTIFNVESSDAKVGSDLKASGRREIYGPVPSTEPTMPVYYQGTFRGPSIYDGQWDLILNKDTGKALLSYDNFDGQLREFSLICRASE